MKILVLGGTGAMGIHLVKLLVNDGAEVFVTTRSNKKSNGSEHYINGNAHDFEFLQKILIEHKWEVIVDFMNYSTESFRERIQILLNSTNQYIFLSSSRVYANSDKFLTETSPRLLDITHDKEFLASDEYGLAKARQEDILKSSGKNNWTIIRPYITYSENRLQLGVLEKEEWLYRAIKGRTIVLSQEFLAKKTTLTYGLDVANAIGAVISKPKSLSEIFHVTNEVSVKWEDVLNLYLSSLKKYLGFEPKVLLVSQEQFYSLHPSKYQIIYDRLFDREFDNSKILKYIDVKNFISTNVGLKSCLEVFLNCLIFNKINWKLEAMKDRQTGEKTPIWEISRNRNKLIYLLYRYII